MNQSRISRAILILVFAALLCTPFIMRRIRIAGTMPTETASAEASINRYGFHLTEATQVSGVDFVHEAPRLDPKLDHIMAEVASMGAGVSVADFDRDGWQDFYVTNSGENSRNRLYRNLGNGKFEDVAAKMGVADVNRPGTGVSMGAVWGDYDNDGYEDLFVYKWGRPELFHNDGGKRFTRVTETAGLPAWMNANTAIWLDYDRDGWLDLFIGGYYRENLDLWNLKDTRIMPESFEYARNGGRKYLFRNRLGEAASGIRGESERPTPRSASQRSDPSQRLTPLFEDVTEKTGLHSTRWALAVAAADLRGTGYPDIFIANDYGLSEIFLNEGGKRFREAGKKMLYWNPFGPGPKSGMNASFGDILNQGKFAIYVSNISEEGILLQGNNLWVPKEGTSGDSLQYDNMASEMGVELGGWSFGAQFGDLNNDGSLDIYLTNGYLSASPTDSYWYDFSRTVTGNSAIISDARYWPPVNGRSHAGYQPKRVWINDGAGKFTDVAQVVGATDRYDGRAVALADFGNRGALDVVVANQKGPLLLYKNTVSPDNKWVAFELEGTKSNRSAIGAQVRVFWNGQQQLQEVSGGCGFCAQNQRRLHFGLGKDPKVEKVVIRWPSGVEQTLPAPQLNQIHRIKEPG